MRALHEGVIVGLANHTLLIAKDGASARSTDSAAADPRSTGDRRLRRSSFRRRRRAAGGREDGARLGEATAAGWPITL